MVKKITSVDDIKVGDRILFNDGKEKLTVTVTRINKSRREIDVKWRRRETILLYSDFTNGYLSKK